MSKIIGITGLIGSGKSLVASYFQQLGIMIIDTDIISHQLTGYGGRAVSVIMKTFGTQIIDKHGAIDRKLMRDLVFADVQQRQLLEQLLHPLIFDEVKLQIQDAGQVPYLLIVVPLLFKVPQYLSLIERSIFVDCDEITLIRRVNQRSGLPVCQIKAILATQVPRDVQLQLADDILDNNGTIENLRAQVLQLHVKYNNLFKN